MGSLGGVREREDDSRVWGLKDCLILVSFTEKGIVVGEDLGMGNMSVQHLMKTSISYYAFPTLQIHTHVHPDSHSLMATSALLEVTPCFLIHSKLCSLTQHLIIFSHWLLSGSSGKSPNGQIKEEVVLYFFVRLTNYSGMWFLI